jgi:hypothetical protein
MALKWCHAKTRRREHGGRRPTSFAVSRILKLWSHEMVRRRSATQAAIARALKGAQAAGLKIGRFEIEGDKIVVYSSEDARLEPASEYDAWRMKRDAR